MTNKKLKAAIMGVIYFLQEEENRKASKVENKWSRFGRETTMRNGIQVQTRSARTGLVSTGLAGSFTIKRFK